MYKPKSYQKGECANANYQNQEILLTSQSPLSIYASCPNIINTLIAIESISRKLFFFNLYKRKCIAYITLCLANYVCENHPFFHFIHINIAFKLIGMWKLFPCIWLTLFSFQHFHFTAFPSVHNFC